MEVYSGVGVMRYETIDKQINRISSSIDAMPGIAAQAAVYALNRTAGWLKEQIADEVSKEKRIKLQLIRNRIKVLIANKRQMAATLKGDFRGIMVIDLGNVEQTPLGVVAGGVLYPHAFKAKLKKGQEGVYRRVGRKRFPIRAVRMPIYEEAEQVITKLLDKDARNYFEYRFLHEIDRLGNFEKGVQKRLKTEMKAAIRARVR